MKKRTEKARNGLAVVNASDVDHLASRNVNFFPGVPAARKDYASAALSHSAAKTPEKLSGAFYKKSKKNEGDGLTIWLLGLLSMNRIYSNFKPADPAPTNEIS